MVCMLPHVLVCGHACAVAHIWRLEDNLQDLILSIYYVDSGARTQVIKLSGKPRYPLWSPKSRFVTCYWFVGTVWALEGAPSTDLSSICSYSARVWEALSRLRPQSCVLGQELWDSAWLLVKLPWKDEAQASLARASRKLCIGNSACLTMVGLATPFLHPVGAIFN